MAISEETRGKLLAAWEKRRLTFIPPMKGQKMSAESRQKMSEAAKNRPSNRTGKKHTPETCTKISATLRVSENVPRGEAVNTFKDGKVSERKGLRYSSEYRRWRYDVFSRDSFTCQQCGDAKGGNLRAHHIKPFADFPELRFDVTNGITLCQFCHDVLHDKPNSTRKVARAKREAKRSNPAD